MINEIKDKFMAKCGCDVYPESDHCRTHKTGHAYCHNSSSQINEIENQIKTEAAVFWAEIESNLPKSREMAALGKEKVYQAFYPAWVEFRKYFISSSLKALLESLISDLEGEKKRGKYRAKYCSQCGEEIGYDRANKEYFCGTCPFRSSESKEDLTQSQGDWNQALNLAQERIRGKLK